LRLVATRTGSINCLPADGEGTVTIEDFREGRGKLCPRIYALRDAGSPGVRRGYGIGLILMRFGTAERSELPSAILVVVARFGPRLAEAFVVVERGRVRACFSQP
jgi:hypothetical protein